MRSSKRVFGLAVAAACVAGAVVFPSTAQAQSCVPLPVSSTGITIEGAGEEVRVPSVSGVAVCYVLPGTTGIPWVQTEPGGGVSVLITGSSSGSGYVSLRYTTDGSANELKAPVPGTGGGSETCLVGVGFPARSDCAFKVSPDNDPVPTLPPIPTTPPVPTKPPTPTVPPVPDDVCATATICLSDVPVIIERLPEIIDRAIEIVIERVGDIIQINCGTLNPNC